MSVLDKLKSHYQALGVQSIEVPEAADEDGKPLVIYWSPLTLAEKKKLTDKATSITDVGLLADVVILKAMDKDGKKLFSLEDKLDIMHKVSSDVIQTIATSIFDSTPIETLKKK